MVFLPKTIALSELRSHPMRVQTIDALLSEKNATTRIHRFEIELLLAHALKKARVFILTHPEFHITKKIKDQFDRFLERRKNNEPVALIIGRKEFYGRNFFVNQYTLIPRPETELLVEKILEHITESKEENFQKEKSRLILDIGTGSGNIITTLAKEIEKKKSFSKSFSFVATDISKEALSTARKNAKNLGTEKAIRFIRSDLFENIPKKLFQEAQERIIAANLPYLSQKAYAATPPDVRNYEPQSALESGKDGIDHYRRLLKELVDTINQTPTLTIPTTLFLEIDPLQKNILNTLALEIFPNARVDFFRDLAGKWRLARVRIE
jgi:release factor glutamine methyltransferase